MAWDIHLPPRGTGVFLPQTREETEIFTLLLINNKNVASLRPV
jgi:hypothetical protein